LTHLNSGFLGRLRITYHRQVDKRFAPVGTAKHCIIPIETLFKDLPFLFIRQNKLWKHAQFMVAMVTRFSWYFAANTTVF